LRYSSQFNLLLASELSLGYDDFDILKDNGKVPNTIESSSKYPQTARRSDSLIRYGLELIRGIYKPLTDLVCELNYGDKIAYAKAKVHCGLESQRCHCCSGRTDSKKMPLYQESKYIVAVSLFVVGSGGHERTATLRAASP
jgi:hypothetical protein